MNESEVAFRKAVQRFADIVCADDSVFFDSLPGRVESSLGSPMAALGVVNESTRIEDVVDAVLLVEEIAVDIEEYVPEELSDLIKKIADARRNLQSCQ
ncbi:hypothetical protein [Actinoplanes sp. L3-i22]|uniref:hypothetical protein n=1 Tax=Actinoplanes sp. L3-i22 TaxID=2836373 RepID=UPI001C77657F|nr:hypothetical protein [Actinoplanes sp. L3-i22]BCY13638.1 hypothetical protein L3i22_087260 [Actinoplanes sp. L3-i22]